MIILQIIVALIGGTLTALLVIIGFMAPNPNDPLSDEVARSPLSSLQQGAIEWHQSGRGCSWAGATIIATITVLLILAMA